MRPAYSTVWSSLYVTGLLIGSGLLAGRLPMRSVIGLLVSLYPSTFAWSHLYLVKTVEGIVTEILVPLRRRSIGGLISQPAQDADLRSCLVGEPSNIPYYNFSVDE